MSAPASIACLDEQTLFALADGRLQPFDRELAQGHLAGCQRCASAVADVVRARREPADEVVSRPGPGTLIDRFIVLGRVGAGAMGEVYVAHDPKLDRKVALKLLARDALDEHHEQRTARLWREAQALARLNHKNLVSVFDVVSRGDELVIAMEYVPGTNLLQWLRERPRPWREVLRVFIDAGRGLAAAHRAGLIHRDFKPENVLVTPEGEAKVTDFGLARLAGLSTADEVDDEREASSPLSSELTQTGALLGTPAYMAPELFAGRSLDEARQATTVSTPNGGSQAASPGTERSDQFSFCTSVYEGLYGERPFARVPLGSLLRGEARPLKAPPAGSRVPGWVRRALVRGLSADAAARYPTMDALLDALSVDRRARRLRVAVAVAGSLLLAGLAAALIKGPPGPCGDADLRMEWTESDRRSVRDALTRGGASAQSVARIDADLTAWVAAWRRVLEQTCAELPPGRPLPRTIVTFGCFHSVADEFRDAVASLKRADASVVALSEHVVAALPAQNTCQGLAPPRGPAEPEVPRRATTLLKLRIAQLEAMSTRGEVVAALALADAVLADSRREAAPQDEGAALWLVARLARARGDLALAERSARQAILTEFPPRVGGSLARSWLRLAFVLGLRAAREPASASGLLVQADDLVDLALAANRARGEGDGVAAELALARAQVALVRGADDAPALAESAVEAARATGDRRRTLEDGLLVLAAALRARGDAAGSLRALEAVPARARSSFEQGQLDEALAWAAWRAGDAARGRALAAAARRELEEAGGFAAPDLARLSAWQPGLEHP